MKLMVVVLVRVLLVVSVVVSVTVEVTGLTDSQRERLHGDLLTPASADLVTATVAMQYPGSVCQLLVTGNLQLFSRTQLCSLNN